MKKPSEQHIKQLENVPDFKHGSLKNEILSHFFDDSINLLRGELSDVYPITVECIGITYPDPAYRIARYRRPNYIFEYVTDGVGYVENDGKHYTVRRGDVYVLEPHSTHTYGADPKEPYSKMWINFRSKHFGQIFSALGLSGVTHFPKADCKELFTELTQLDRVSLFNQYVCYDALKILLQICAELMKSLRTDNKVVPQEILNVKRKLDDALYTNVSIEKICESLHLSRSFVINQFKTHYGLPPHQYLLNAKIRHAKTMLRQSAMRIGEIADLLGFCDEYAFSNIFKKKTGISPKEFRQLSEEQIPPDHA